MTQEAKLKIDEERERRNQNRPIPPVNFYVRQIVLARKFIPAKQGRFDNLWEGPYGIIQNTLGTMQKIKK